MMWYLSDRLVPLISATTVEAELSVFRSSVKLNFEKLTNAHPILSVTFVRKNMVSVNTFRENLCNSCAHSSQFQISIIV